ncbi:hypothetical protein PR202_gb08042 [Eleusine coracana subsp. coracana]|uniref:MATH domain-containing protein n=1 Tax=Eleusine coracana subsp. coracana TaxID=191504 RepID=A0AAV5ECX7_ELECO|nr:hypothetical protein PR202_gb08042 [Eleusine coracana subsp. coracana]
MSPAATAGEPLRSASSIIADAARGYHILKIDGYSLTKGTPNGEYIKSHTLTLGGHRWYIRYYPNGDRSESKDYVSFFLALDQSVDKAVKARFQIRFMDTVDKKALALGGVHSYTSNGCYGYTKFIKKEDFEKSELLKYDSFSVRCDIIVLNEFRVEETANTSTPAFVTVPPSNLHQHLGDLLRSEKGADVVFEVGNKTFAAHR